MHPLELTLICRLATVASNVNQYSSAEVAEAKVLGALALLHVGGEASSPAALTVVEGDAA